jgi:multiple sugar transport system ATP-binding protein
MGQINSTGDQELRRRQVIPPLDLTIEDGEFTVFVGPSGCGKSTLLRLIAGLEDITTGHIEIDGKDATDVPPAKRGLAMVFQSYALYPHMSRAQEHRLPAAHGEARPGRASKRRRSRRRPVLNLTDYLDRRPGQLSGGQRQRVAIGRAIVREPRRSSSTNRCRTSMPRCGSACGWRSANCTSG